MGYRPPVKNFVCAPPVGDAGDDPRMLDDLAECVAVQVCGLGVEDGSQVVGHRDVEHRIHRVLARSLRDLRDRQVLERLRLGRGALEDHDVGNRHGHDSRAIVAKPGAAVGVGELALALRGRADRRLGPRGAVVEEVPVLEGEREGRRGRHPLAVHAQAALATRVEPGEEHAMGFRHADERLDHVVDDRPAAHVGQLLDVREIVAAVGRRQRRLHEALIALCQHLREAQRGLVVHHVGHHRTAVVVALHRAGSVGMEALSRPAAAARVHGVVEEPAQLGMLRLAGPLAGLGAIEAQHPHQQRRHRDVRQHVDGLRRAVDAVEELGIGDPVPRQPATHRLERDGLDPRHGEHRALAKLRPHRREPEAAVADHHRGDAVPAGERQVGIPEELRVVVRVEIDEAGRDDLAARVEDPPRVRSA